MGVGLTPKHPCTKQCLDEDPVSLVSCSLRPSVRSHVGGHLRVSQ